MSYSGGKIENILEICELLAEQENMRVTFKEAAKGALLTGLGALAGGLLGGKNGLLLGGALGSAASYMVASDFKSVVDVIRKDLTPAQRRKLADRVGKLLTGSMSLADAGVVMATLSQNGSLKNSVISEIGSFLQSELHMSVV